MRNFAVSEISFDVSLFLNFSVEQKNFNRREINTCLIGTKEITATQCDNKRECINENDESCTFGIKLQRI